MYDTIKKHNSTQGLQNMVFSSTSRMFTKFCHMLDYKTNLRFQKCDILRKQLSEKKMELKYMIQLLKIRFYILQNADYNIQTEFTKAYLVFL